MVEMTQSVRLHVKWVVRKYTLTTDSPVYIHRLYRIIPERHFLLI